MGDVNKTLAEWQQRTAAATEGPWAIWRDLDYQGFLTVGDAESYKEILRDGEAEECNPTAHVYTDDDAKFIVAAREAMPKLLAALRAVEALCNDPYAVPFASKFGTEVPEDGVLVSDIRQALNDALLASEPSGSEQ